MLYEMASLKCPFDARDMRGLVIKILRGNYPPLPRTFSPELTNLVAKCLCRTPAQRPSVNDLLAMPVIRARIERFLSDAQRASEFSHTVLHKNPEKNHEHPAMAAPPPALVQVGNPALRGVGEAERRGRDEGERRAKEEVTKPHLP